MRIALISQSIVQNIIEADDLAFAQTLGFEQVVEATEGAYLGGQYTNGQFVPMPADVAVPPATSPIMTKLAFLRRFTQSERLAIRAAKATDPIIEDADALMQLAQEIDVTDADTAGYVGYLAQRGFVAPERAAEILAPEIVA